MLHRPLIGIFTADESAISLARQVLLVDILLEIFRAVNMVSDQSLNACGHVKITLGASAISCWLFSVVLAYILGTVLGLGLVGIWLAFLGDELARAVFYLIYWGRHKGSLLEKKTAV